MAYTDLDMTGASVPTTNYAVPAGAIFVSTSGNDANPGTQASPKRTVFGASGAYSTVPSGGTIVMRAGVYEEGSVGAGAGVPYRTTACTIQAYPGEQVWFDGSTVVTGWSGAGPYTQTGWTFNPGNTSGFDGVSAVGDKPEVTFYLDQCFIDGVPQTRVTGTTPGAGQFSVVSGTIYLGTNPSGKEVRLTQYRCLAVFAAKVNLKGIGVRRYAPGVDGATNTDLSAAFPSAYTGNTAVLWDGTSENILIERCAFVDNARTTLGITRPGATVDHCVFLRSGQTHMNIGGNSGDGFTLTNSVLKDSNHGLFPPEPGSSAVKVVKTDRSTITDNYIENPRISTGIWYDMHCTRAVIARNKIIGGSGCNRAILFELCGGGLLPLTGTRTQYWSYIVDNDISGGWIWGVFIFDSDYVKIWNNKISGCTNGQIQLLQDERPPSPFWPGTYNSGAVDMLLSNIEVANNDLTGIAGAGRIYTGAASAHYVSTDDAVSLCAGNWFQSGVQYAARWTTSLGVLTPYNSAAALDARPKFVSNSWKNHDGTTAPTAGSRWPIPADVQALIATTGGGSGSTTTYQDLDKTGATIPASNYAIPSGAVYVDPVSGLDTRTLAEAQNPSTPLKTVFGAAGAYSKVPSGGTIIMRGGTYEEGFNGSDSSRTKSCTIQAYPGEQAWFDGSVVVSGFTGSGPYTKTGWTFHPGNTSTISTSNIDRPENGGFPTWYLDMCFIDGVRQQRVLTTNPGPGQFHVDAATNTIYLGTNPSGKTVRMAQYRSLFVTSASISLKGIGVRRYTQGVAGQVGATTGGEVIYYGGNNSTAITTIENCAFTDFGVIGPSINRSTFVVNHCVFARSGRNLLLAGGSIGSDNLEITNSVFIDANQGQFPREPTAAAVKIVRSKDTKVTDNYFDGSPRCRTLWYDISCNRAIVARNKFVGRGAGAWSPLLYEISGGGLYDGVQYWSYIVGNEVIGDWQEGMTLLGSDHVKVWNNTIEKGNRVAIIIYQDERPAPTDLASPGYPQNNGYLTRNIEVCNNDFGPATLYSQVVVYNSTGSHPGTAEDMIARFEGNWFKTPSPVNAAQWGMGSSATYPATSWNDGRIQYNLIPKSAGANALDSRLRFVQNSWDNFQQATAPAANERVTIPADVAALLPGVSGPPVDPPVMPTGYYTMVRKEGGVMVPYTLNRYQGGRWREYGMQLKGQG